MDIEKDLKQLNNIIAKVKKLKKEDDEIINILNQLPKEKVEQLYAVNMSVLTMLKDNNKHISDEDLMKMFNVVFLGACKRIGLIKFI